MVTFKVKTNEKNDRIEINVTGQVFASGIKPSITTLK